MSKMQLLDMASETVVPHVAFIPLVLRLVSSLWLLLLLLFERLTLVERVDAVIVELMRAVKITTDPNNSSTLRVKEAARTLGGSSSSSLLNFEYFVAMSHASSDFVPVQKI
jgi:hypothetical protein